MTAKRYWKFLVERDGQVRSQHGDATWVTGEWQPEVTRVRACSTGYHCSARILDALGYVQGGVLARVEVRGESASEGDKSVHGGMRAVRMYRWTKLDSVALAVYAAELVIGIYERSYQADDRPRKAIEAAKAYLANPTDAASSAASSAASDAASRAAYAAYAASSAASRAASSAASSAAYAASDAASRAASSAAYAASDAASDAAYKEVLEKIERWLVNRVGKLEVIGS